MKTPYPLALLFLFGSALSVSAQAQRKTYKCSVDGRPVFQQTACAVGTEPEAANAAAGAASAAASAPTASKRKSVSAPDATP